jgi:LuxR family maltose regulon positive regulatory protein
LTQEASRTRTASREPALSALYRAKLRRPATAAHYVARPRVLDLFDEVVAAPLTLVVAPAGTGKTSLVAGWAVDSSTPSAWLSLDETDRDTVHFWSGVIAALEPLAPGCGDGASVRLLRHAASRPYAVDKLLADLEREPRTPAVLVIDDFHAVDADEEIAGSFGRFILDLPEWLHVVLLTRREPPLRIERLRSRGQLGEIHLAELRFCADEATELLRRLAPELSEQQIEAAVERADGWAASLQLAALAARSRRAQPAETGASEAEEVLVQDYVLREVLADEAPELIDLLWAAAVVPRINAGLAQRLTGRSDAGELLQRAAERGLFLTRRGVGGWYDLHALVGSVLTAELASRSPERLAELHAQAAQWFEDAGEVLVALRQWLLADRPRDVLRLLAASHGSLYDIGREASVVRMIGAIPTATAVGELDAMVDYAWCHLLVDRRRFVELVGQLAWWVERTDPTDAVRARGKVLQAIAALVSGRWTESAELSRQVMADLGEVCWRDPLGRFAGNLIAREVACAERWDDGSDDVREIEAALSRDPGRRLAFEGTRALGEALAGRPLDALRVAAGVRRAAGVSEMTILRGELEVAEAVAHRELGDHTRALGALRAFVDTPAETVLFYKVLAMCELTHGFIDAGELDLAAHVFHEAEHLHHTESLGDDARGWLARTGTVLALAAGDAEQGRRWAEQVVDPFWGPVCRARAHLSIDDRKGAAATLDAAAPRCVRHEVVLALLRARAGEDRDQAAKHVSVAIDLAAATGMLQTVAAEGTEVLRLVEQAAWRAPGEWLDRLRRCTVHPGSPLEPNGAGLVEPLTDRERDVLRFLPSRLTVREIADELCVSVNTVKFHLRVIYRKLGVNSRADAARAARNMAKVLR